ncbi:MAG: methionine adenosyltransferase [Phycisphaerales bacterium]|nr:MAG: methionine adenosyltransferase [Phycisphaerales bacterium]
MARLFTSESVSMGHPDKVADQISDAILDAMLTEDANARVACETMVSTGMAVVSGECTVDGWVDIDEVVRNTVKEIGYTDPNMSFDFESMAVLQCIKKQSPDIAMGVDKEGAGDQGMMFGFACRETEEYMPLPIQLAHRLVERQAIVRREGIIKGLRPDAKGQVTVEYADHSATSKPSRVRTLVMSTQHDKTWNDRQDALRKEIVEHVFKPVLGDWWKDDIQLHVNPTGRFEIGGPHGDCGLTGRKIIVDTYGGRGRHGGGAFSGKDPTKVDRSATYMARYIAKNVVAASLADVCEVQLSYAIGVVEPTSVLIDCQGTNKVSEQAIEKAVENNFRLTPRGIIETLNLRKPIYTRTARHGHFGRIAEGDFFTWEKTDMAEKLKKACS